jgi:hypothetical protein
VAGLLSAERAVLQRRTTSRSEQTGPAVAAARRPRLGACSHSTTSRGAKSAGADAHETTIVRPFVSAHRVVESFRRAGLAAPAVSRIAAAGAVPPSSVHAPSSLVRTVTSRPCAHTRVRGPVGAAVKRPSPSLPARDHPRGRTLRRRWRSSRHRASAPVHSSSPWPKAHRVAVVRRPVPPGAERSRLPRPAAHTGRRAETEGRKTGYQVGKAPPRGTRPGLCRCSGLREGPGEGEVLRGWLRKSLKSLPARESRLGTVIGVVGCRALLDHAAAVIPSSGAPGS